MISLTKMKRLEVQELRLTTGLFFNFSNSQKQYCTNVYAVKTTFSRSRITSITNFLVTYTSYESKIARETDLEFKNAKKKKYTDIFAQGAMTPSFTRLNHTNASE